MVLVANHAAPEDRGNAFRTLIGLRTKRSCFCSVSYLDPVAILDQTSLDMVIMYDARPQFTFVHLCLCLVQQSRAQG